MKKSKSIYLGLFVLGISFLVGCANIDPETGERDDPLEGFNRVMWHLNYNILDPYVLRPAAVGWKEYLPSPVTTGLANVVNNLDEPFSFVNRLLEGDVEKAMTHFTRFWFNSIFGLGGLINWADYNDNLQTNGNRTLDHTVGSYGVDTGSYIILPLSGPGTIRQTVTENVVEYPIAAVTNGWWLFKTLIQAVDGRAQLLESDALLAQSTDSYKTAREAYFQNLEFQISDGKVEENSTETLSEDELKNIDQ